MINHIWISDAINTNFKMLLGAVTIMYVMACSALFLQCALPSSPYYKMHRIPKLKCFLSRPAVVFVQYIKARCQVENEDVVGAAPTGDAPTTSE